MVDKFNIDPGVRPAPNLSPGTGGIGGNPGNIGQGIASLFEGVGGFLGGLNAQANKANLTNIDKVINAGNIIPDTVDRLPPTNPDASTTPTGTPGAKAPGTPTATANAPVTLPNEINSGAVKAQNAYEAFKQGKLSESNFWSMVATQQRDLMAKYPQYTKEIEDKYKRLYGVNPQEKVVNTHFEAQKAKEAELKDEEKKWNSLKSEAASLGISPNEILAGDNNPQIRQKIEGKVLAQKANDANRDAQKKNLELKKAQGEDTETEYFRVAQTDIKQTVDTIFTNTMDAVESGGVSLRQINEKKAAAMSDGVISPQELQELTTLFSQFKLVANQRIGNAMQQYSDKMSPEKFMALKKYSDDQLKFYEDNILSGNTGILEWNKKVMESARSGDAYSVMQQSPTMRRVGAAKVIGGEAAANTIITNQLGDIKKEATSIRLYPMVGGMIGGQPMVQGLNEHTKDAPPEVRAELADKAIKGGVSTVLNPKSSPEVVKNVISSLFGPENAKLIDEFHPNSRTKVFNMLASTSMIMKLQELKKTDPESYEKFRGWSTTTFNSLMTEHTSNLKNHFYGGDTTTVSQAKNPLIIGFDGQQFTVSVNPKFDTSRAQDKERFINLYASPNAPITGGMRSTIESVREMNRAISIMKPIVEDGSSSSTVDTLLSPFFKGVGIDKNARTDLDYVAKAYNEWKLSEDQIDKLVDKGSKLSKGVGEVAENPRTPLDTGTPNLAAPDLPPDPVGAGTAGSTEAPPAYEPTGLETGGAPEPTAPGERPQPVLGARPESEWGTPTSPEELATKFGPDGRPLPVLGARPESEWGKPTDPAEFKRGRGRPPKTASATAPVTAVTASNPLGLVVQSETEANANPMTAGFIRPTDGSYNPQATSVANTAPTPSTGSVGATNGVPMDLTNYLNKTGRVESGGKTNAKNPLSSATGLFQFIGSTWKSLMRKYPELGLTADGRTNREQQIRAMVAFTRENEAILRQKGVPVNDGTRYLAHFAGPAGAVKLAKADPNASVESVLGQSVVKANPFLRGKSVAWVQNWAQKKMA